VSVFFLPALAKILLTFAVILVLSRYFPLWACLISGAAIVGLWMGLDPFQVIDHVWTYSFSAQSLWLILILGLILVLSDLPFSAWLSLSLSSPPTVLFSDGTEFGHLTVIRGKGIRR